MPSIKDLKKRITSTKNTQQTTKALKMVSAAKLRRATDAILSQRPYAQEIANLMAHLSDQSSANAGTKKPVTLVVAFSSDRGLCGGYNSSVIRTTASLIQEKRKAGKEVKSVFVGKKAFELVKTRVQVDTLHYEEFGTKATFRRATDLAKKILPYFEQGEVNEVIFVFNEFKNAISQEVRAETVLPLKQTETADKMARADTAIFAPSKQEIYEMLASKYFVIQVFRAYLEAQASEHGARMSAMENATKNAGDMIKKLTLQYNKQRQAAITKELLEIISGSESQKAQA